MPAPFALGPLSIVFPATIASLSVETTFGSATGSSPGSPHSVIDNPAPHPKTFSAFSFFASLGDCSVLFVNLSSVLCKATWDADSPPPDADAAAALKLTLLPSNVFPRCTTPTACAA